MTPDPPPRSFTTDKDGLVASSRETSPSRELVLTVKDRERPWRGPRSAIRTRAIPEGTRADPLVMKLLPLTHRVEGTVVDLAGEADRRGPDRRRVALPCDESVMEQDLSE